MIGKDSAWKISIIVVQIFYFLFQQFPQFFLK